MSKIAPHRILSDIVAGLGTGQWGSSDTVHGRQGKSAAFGRAHVVGWIDVLIIQPPACAGACGIFPNNLNTPIAVAPF